MLPDLVGIKRFRISMKRKTLVELSQRVMLTIAMIGSLGSQFQSFGWIKEASLEHFRSPHNSEKVDKQETD